MVAFKCIVSPRKGNSVTVILPRHLGLLDWQSKVSWTSEKNRKRPVLNIKLLKRKILISRSIEELEIVIKLNKTKQTKTSKSQRLLFRLFPNIFLSGCPDSVNKYKANGS